MFEHFAPSALRVFAVAHEESIAFKQFFLDTDHALLGLVADEVGAAGAALALYGVTDGLVRQDIIELVGYGENTTGAGGTPTRDAKQLIELSRRDSALTGGPVETSNLLRALCTMKDSLGYQILVNQLSEEVVADLYKHTLAMAEVATSYRHMEVPNADPSEGAVR
jgi:ATP-dependent Clp protease ATP-binding subunit ClpA